LTSSFPLAVTSWVRFIADDVRIVRGGPLRDHIAVGEVSGVAPRARFLGGGGDDALVGGPQHDVIDGGSGDDHVDGRGGRDICTGGPGDDVVVHCEA
jgi:Ca2+-binding RTX toxin-like protein